VNTWKIILATLVIFAAGAFAGGSLVKATKKAPKAQALRMEMLRRLTGELNLNTEQRTNIENVLNESAERTKILRDLLTPELQAEYSKAVEDIKSELNPAQRKKFEESLQKQKKKQVVPAEKHRRQSPPATESNATVNL
jgi:hypothetical protein